MTNCLELAADGIEELNDKYGNDSHGRFFLFHRPRLFNTQEGCWMGRERKRGKLEDFNELLRGKGIDRFSKIVGEPSPLPSVRYVITLDTDTDLPWGAGWRLVGAAAHPLNRPIMDANGRRLTRGYAILQPRVSISLRSARSRVAIPVCWLARSALIRIRGLYRICTRIFSVRPPISAKASTTCRLSADYWMGGFRTIPY